VPKRSLFSRLVRAQHFYPIKNVSLAQNYMMQNISMRTFNTSTAAIADENSGSSQKRITPRTLCELTGTKYYMHN